MPNCRLCDLQAQQQQVRFCANPVCGCKDDTCWRRCGSDKKLYCNACGQYLQKHNKQRPISLIELAMSKMASFQVALAAH